VHLTRREALRIIAAGPLLAVGGCCSSQYPRSLISDGRIPAAPVEPILAPRRWTGRAGVPLGVIDVHAHFFNGSDVPVRGFVAECIGHNAPPIVQPLLKALAALAEKIADRAPTAAEELDALLKLESDARGPGVDAARAADDWLEQQRDLTAQRLVEIVRGSDFERRYLEMNPTATRTGAAGIDENEVLDVVTGARERDVARSPSGPQEARASAARAKLEFLFYMLAPRAENLRAYIDAYAGENDPAGVDTVLGALVDFDYWLDCPPRSSHDDQIALHKHLARLHGGFMRPIAAYNPWTDIEQHGAGLDRVLNAWESGMFAGVKIYPPTGFMAAGNATAKVKTGKRRPDLRRLDEILETFFGTCAERQIPVLAHAAHSNGRDDVHDEFSAPATWDRLVCRMATGPHPPILSFGHFGGDNSSTGWTQQFANLIRSQPSARLFADLGYWDTLLCGDAKACQASRTRLKEALAVRISDTETLADRVMFASDWLMLSQVTGWREYPPHVRDAVSSIAPEAVDSIMGGNATRCFSIPPRP
jgi:predicted TIM-barrel fold metal-dependent hydrolase